MKQFDLSLWLRDKSRKVVTRDGRPVRIVCWDAKVDERQKEYHIIALVDSGTAHGEDCSYFNEQGAEFFKREYLFFADEEEKNIDDTEMNSLAYLTELGYTCIPPKKEEELTDFEKELKAMIQDVERGDFIDESFGFWKDRLLALAKKEILKDLPKWKKITKDEVQVIKEEIKRRINRFKGEIITSYTNGWIEAYEELLQFINSIPKESDCEVNFTNKNEELEEELTKYIESKFTIDKEQLNRFGIKPEDYTFSLDKRNLMAIARHFAEWQKQQMMKDVFIDNYIVHDGRIEIEGDPIVKEE